MSGFNSSLSGSSSRILSSKWDGLSDRLIARFFPVKRIESGNGWEQSRDKREISAADKFVVDDGFEVHCPITDGNQEMTLNWQSMFENAGPDSKAPTFSAMLQSGSLASTLQGFGGKGEGGSAATAIAQLLGLGEGRTGISRLNSTQVFTGMPPVKLTMTLHFRALSDPESEVKAPIQQLEEWAVPQYLAADGLITNAITNGGKQTPMQTVFPSMSPQIIGMKYGDVMLLPLVIESIGKPITAPRSKDGVMVNCSVQMTLSTLTALDRRDIRKMYV